MCYSSLWTNTSTYLRDCWFRGTLWFHLFWSGLPVCLQMSSGVISHWPVCNLANWPKKKKKKKGKKRPILSTWERGAALGEIAGRENESEKDREKKRGEIPKGEVMCESNLSYLMAYPRFLVLSICHRVNQDLWASSPLQILIMLLQIKSDTQVLKGVCLWPDGLIFREVMGRGRGCGKWSPSVHFL